MSRRRKGSSIHHAGSLLLLLALDVHQRARRVISRTFLRAAAGLLSVGLLVMTFTSLYALRQVTRSVQSIIGDSMVGMEASVAMRAIVRETQLDLLRLRIASDRRLPVSKVAAFEGRIYTQLRSYRRGVFDVEDEKNARRIEEHLGLYLATLQPIIDDPQPDVVAFTGADEAARELVDAVETAYQFNRHRINVSAAEASDAARRALAISNRLWWSFAGFATIIVLIYLAYRWLALPEGNDG